MYDPHELLQYLWETDRIKISAGLIEQLDYFEAIVVFKCVKLFSKFKHCNVVKYIFVVSPQLGNIGNIGVQSMLGHATTLAIMMRSL